MFETHKPSPTRHRSRLKQLWAVPLTVLLIASFCALAFSPPGSAQTVVSIVLSPNTNLKGGDQVSVSAPAGTFPPGAEIFIGQCNNDPALPTDGSACVPQKEGGSQIVTAGTDGSLSGVSLTLVTGELSPGGAGADVCPPTEAQISAGTACMVTLTTLDGSIAAFAQIDFATSAPTSAQSAQTSSTSEASNTSQANSSQQTAENEPAIALVSQPEAGKLTINGAGWPSSLSQKDFAVSLCSGQGSGSDIRVSCSAEAVTLNSLISDPNGFMAGDATVTLPDPCIPCTLKITTNAGGSLLDARAAVGGVNTGTLSVSPASAKAGDTITIKGTGWSPGKSISVVVTPPPFNGSAVGSSTATTTDAQGSLNASIVVTADDVKKASGGVLAVAAGDLTDPRIQAGELPLHTVAFNVSKDTGTNTPKATDSSKTSPLKIVKAELKGSGPLLSLLGIGRPKRTAVITVQNSSDRTIEGYLLSVTTPGGVELQDESLPNSIPLEPGERATYEIPLKLPALKLGKVSLPGFFSESANGPKAEFTASKFVAPWLLFLVLLGLVLALLRMQLRRYPDPEDDDWVASLADSAGRQGVEDPSQTPASRASGTLENSDAPTGTAQATQLGTEQPPNRGAIRGQSADENSRTTVNWADRPVSDRAGGPPTESSTPMQASPKPLSVVRDRSTTDQTNTPAGQDWAPTWSKDSAQVTKQEAQPSGNPTAMPWDIGTSSPGVVSSPESSGTQQEPSNAETASAPTEFPGHAKPSPRSTHAGPGAADEPTAEHTPVFSSELQGQLHPTAPRGSQAQPETAPNSAIRPFPAISEQPSQVASAPRVLTNQGLSQPTPEEIEDQMAPKDPEREALRSGLTVTPVSKTITLRRDSMFEDMTIFHGKIDDITVTDTRDRQLGWAVVVEPESPEELRGGLLRVRPKLGRVIDGDRSGLRRSAQSVAEPGAPSPLLQARGGSGRGTYSTGATLDLVVPARISDTKTLSLNLIVGTVPDDRPVTTEGAPLNGTDN